jgi:hypothetical protein
MDAFSAPSIRVRDWRFTGYPIQKAAVAGSKNIGGLWQI